MKERINLGAVHTNSDIPSLMPTKDGELEKNDFYHFPGYSASYPAVVTTALGNLYSEYNQAFTSLVWQLIGNHR